MMLQIIFIKILGHRVSLKARYISSCVVRHVLWVVNDVSPACLPPTCQNVTH